MTQTKVRPQSGRVYSLRRILTELSLKDSPHLVIQIGRKAGAIQTSHLEDLDLMLANPKLGDSLWRFICTTHEWCEIFHFAGPDTDLEGIVDISDDESDDPFDENGLLIEPIITEGSRHG